jgi:hypothetical protein
MEVYEKATRISWWLLGFVALRELLTKLPCPRGGDTTKHENGDCAAGIYKATLRIFKCLCAHGRQGIRRRLILDSKVLFDQ